ncbi:MAG TPA: heavy metal-binding domain-containing protein [Bradyrhizobium sp.]
MGIFDIFKKPDAETIARQAARAERVADIQRSLQNGDVPAAIRTRLEGARRGRLPWTATLTPAELMITRSHGLKPIAAVSATCWLHYGWSWTEGHAEGWNTALRRLQEEARVAGANAVLDVKMRTIPLGVSDSMDFSLVGTAVHVEGLPPSDAPIIATVPALEFVKLLEADVVPTGIAIGAHYQWMNDWRRSTNLTWMGNIESQALSELWETVRQRAHQDLRANARAQGNGVLAHLNFSQMFEREGQGSVKQYLARHIVVATTVDARRGTALPHQVRMVVDLHAGGTPLVGTVQHHQSYSSNESEGAI